MATVLRRRLPLFLLLPLLLLLAACSDSDKKTAPPAVSESAAAPATTITWSFWGDAWELAVNRRVVRAFEREHPEISVQIEHHPWGEYFTWLKGEWAAGR